MFSFLCILLGLFQFAFLLLVSGIFLSLAIVSRLMEVVITLIHPTSVFFLRQSVKLFVQITILSARTTGYVLCKIIERVRDAFFEAERSPDINITPPVMTYERIAYPDMDHPYLKPFTLNVSTIEEQTLSDFPKDEGASVSEEGEGASVSQEGEGAFNTKEGEGASNSKEGEVASEIPSEP